MTPSAPKNSSGITGMLVFVLVIVLLAGAVLVRLVGEDSSPVTSAASGETTRMPSGDALASGASGGPPREGNAAPDFTLPNLDSHPISLSDWRGQPVLINFWATWCAPCEVEMPAIQAAFEAHRDEGLVVLAVAVDDSAKKVREFFDGKNLTLQPLMDDGTVARDYQVFGLPTSFFVAPNGRIAVVHIGMLTEKIIEEYLARTIAED